MAKVQTQKLEIPQGTTFRYDFLYVDPDVGVGLPPAIIPLTGYTGRCQFRESVEDNANFFEATTENGKLVIDGPNGKVTLVIQPVDSTPWTVFEAVYDLEIVAPNTDVIRLVQGNVIIDPEVTR